jgi:alpha-D-ribose 1-methylphosphonate 5-triphosphate diphosphatase
MWLSDFRLVLADRIIERGSLHVSDGHIAEIIEGPAPQADFLGQGLTIFPGIIDLHGDMLEREIEPRPKAILPIAMAVHELDKRLAATGVTTAFAAISFHWHTHIRLRSEEWAREIVATVHRLRDELLTDMYIHARFEVTNPEAGPVLKQLIAVESVHLISLMDHTPGQGQYRDIEHYVHTMVEWRKLRSGGDVSEAELRAHVQELQSRPKSWDVVNEVAAIAKQRAIPLASHDDDSVEKVDFVSNLGTTISEFPVLLESAVAAKARGMHVIMGAPNALLGKSNTNNLSALDGIKAGVVDILAADYHPAALLQAVHSISAKGILSLTEATRLISLNPANAAGLTDRGSLAEGKIADLVLVEMGEYPRVRATLRRGKPIYWDGYPFAQSKLLFSPLAEQRSVLA